MLSGLICVGLTSCAVYEPWGGYYGAYNGGYYGGYYGDYGYWPGYYYSPGPPAYGPYGGWGYP